MELEITDLLRVYEYFTYIAHVYVPIRVDILGFSVFSLHVDYSSALLDGEHDRIAAAAIPLHTSPYEKLALRRC